MKTVTNVILVILIIAVIAIALFFRQGSRNPLCQPAVYLGRPGNQPRAIIEGLIDDLGGLPQQNARLDAIDDPRIIVPVDDWRIRSAVVTNSNDSFVQTLREESPVMDYAIDLDVAWEDGAAGIVQWTGWRYGLVSCPVAVSKGGGPMGAIRIVELTPAPPQPDETPEATPEG